MSHDISLGERLRRHGISRRALLKFCASTASMMAIPPAMVPALAANLEKLRRPSVIWLSFQECTGCTESLTRSGAPTIESLIFDTVSLDYHHTLQAASGHAAEAAKQAAMEENYGDYILIVDGSIPTGNPGYSTIAGIDNLSMLKEAAPGAKAIISIGTCSAFGGLPMAEPNPTGAKSVSELLPDRTIINVPGCPPIGEVITGVLVQILAFGDIPELDHLGRPMAFYGQNIHDRCYRRPFYERGLFAETFDDEGARKGWCLYKLGCKGPTTYNACAVMKTNDLAVAGAKPLYLTLNAFIEEGLETALLDRIVQSLAKTARETGVKVVAGDTKVLRRGEGGGLYLATTGVGVRFPGVRPAMSNIRAGDIILISGSIGDHGTAVMLAREDFGLRGDLRSDAASVLPLTRAMLTFDGLRFMRDPTRGGIASVAHEIIRATGLGVRLAETVPVKPQVQAVCDMLGYDPYYLACEGRVVAIVAAEEADAALESWQQLPTGQDAAIAGRITENDQRVILETALGGERFLEELEDDPLPRIC